MSEFWRQHRNDAVYRKVTRPFVLRRDRYHCQVKGPRCAGRATQVHHINGVSLASLNDVDQCVASCKPCNLQEGRPAADPAPTRRTRW